MTSDLPANSLVTAQGLNSLNPEGRLESTAFLGTLWALSAQSMLRKAVDVDHLLLNSLAFKFHSKFRQIFGN